MKRAAVLALLLAACSGNGAPSERNLRDALAAANNRGAREAVRLACQQSRERPGYVCDYRAPACNRYTGACGTAKPFTGRFLYAGSRWQLVEDLTPRAQPDPVTQPLPGVAVVAPAPTPAAPAPVVADADPSALPDPQPTIAPPPPPGGYDEPLRPKDIGRISEWIGLDAQCRAGRDDESWDACRDRDRLARRLERRGLCHTGAGWRPCD